jgi:hypothetical protein
MNCSERSRRVAATRFVSGHDLSRATRCREKCGP